MSTTVLLEPKNESAVTAGEGVQGFRAIREAATVHELDPLSDSRWPEFVNAHPRSSIFHTRAWLEALHKTYGYQPVAYTTSDSARLDNAVVFCLVKSPLTGKRLVSLPFSDHCQPLAAGADLEAILGYLARRRVEDRLRYVELRPREWDGEAEATAFFENSRTNLQTIDLTPDLNAIYKRFHDSCIRRKIKKAEKEALVYESGRSEELVEKFRALMLLTRRRHRLPPQPAAWFRNLVSCLGERLEIHLVSKQGVPAASILTLRHGKQMTYKYGCSDAQFNNLGGTPLLFWKVIQQAKENGAEEFDLGRSDASDPGLIAFKGHLGAQTTELLYYRNPEPAARLETSGERHAWARNAFARMPDFILQTTGELLYRHIG